MRQALPWSIAFAEEGVLLGRWLLHLVKKIARINLSSTQASYGIASKIGQEFGRKSRIGEST